jgi:hypothetical protein
MPNLPMTNETPTRLEGMETKRQMPNVSMTNEPPSHLEGMGIAVGR